MGSFKSCLPHCRNGTIAFLIVPRPVGPGEESKPVFIFLMLVPVFSYSLRRVEFALELLLSSQRSEGLRNVL